MEEFNLFIDSIRSFIQQLFFPIEAEGQVPQPVDDLEINTQNSPKLEREIDSDRAHKDLVDIYSIMAGYRHYILTISERKCYWQLAALELDLDLTKFNTMRAHLNLYREIVERQRQNILRSRTLWQEELNLARANLNELAIDKALASIDICDKLEIDIDRVENAISSQIDTLEETSTTVKSIQSLIRSQGDALKSSYQGLADRIYTNLVAEGVRHKYTE